MAILDMSRWWTSSSGYIPLRQNSLTDTRSEGLLSAMAEHSTKVAADHDLESGSPTPVSAFKYIATGKRRRPLMLTALAGVLCFSTTALAAFYTYNRVMPDLPVDVEGDTKWESIDLPDEVPPQATQSGAVVIANDPTHVLVPVTDLPAPPPLLLPLDTRPPLDVLVHYYETGELLNAVDSDTHPSPRVDLVYMWVNASDPFFGPARAAKVKEEAIPNLKGTERHYRDNGELRGAVRSGALALGNRVNQIHLVSAAFSTDDAPSDVIPTPPEGATGFRIGQVPEWLDWQNKGNLQWHFQPEIFRLPRDTNGAVPPSILDINEEEWRALSLPTFNSFQIENRLAFIQGLGEQLVVSNDDMFMLRHMATTDYHHPILGMITRLDPGTTVKPVIASNLLSHSGEWGGLQHANFLISQRFPSRTRQYMHHLPKSLTRSLMHEAQVMFAKQLTLASTRTFRESRRGVGDIEMAWLVTHLQIERWREGLLWTWAVARVGGLDGKWGADARAEMRAALGFDEDWSSATSTTVSGQVTIDHIIRSTLKDAPKLTQKGGWEEPKATTYLWSSFDGHLPVNPPSSPEEIEEIEKAAKGRKGKLAQFAQKLLGPPTQCNFDISECLPDEFFSSDTEYDATEIFKTIAFAKPQCGDCLIGALVNKSGKRGLSAFLPSKDVNFRPPAREAQMWDRPEPMLPLVDKWEDADFSLANNVRLGQDIWKGVEPSADDEVNLRNWSVKLLSRYSYVYSTTPARFAMVHSVLQLHKALKEVDNTPELALLCVNDDQPDVARNSEKGVFQAWMKKTLGGASRYVRWENNEAWNEPSKE
ncbi:uncharacterized protein EHS24_002549 [Apiotrichum porosum]|uniref:Stealth protein CR3 conserved region 3 domain-containing protein n=1 Tax=Apiotrichum porosum TaxID=105984 RepID=A0A427XH55_9TREE|nr:uncharacterized protein EHS24_002549 [Apiotrichum porosum]RSH78093.1 hypothetical protein EHS24_002549 [Apiotrichum porosum]